MQNVIVLATPFAFLVNFPESLKPQILVMKRQRIKATWSLLLYRQRATIYTAWRSASNSSLRLCPFFVVCPKVCNTDLNPSTVEPDQVKTCVGIKPPKNPATRLMLNY